MDRAVSYLVKRFRRSLSG